MPEKFEICKDTKTNDLISNTNQNKRIEIAYEAIVIVNH